jgi:ankyrin repeat protein
MLPELKRMLLAGDVESIRLWLDAGVDVDVVHEEGWTPLLLTCYKGHAYVAL